MGRIHLGSIFGTTITLDFTFLILIVFFMLNDLNHPQGARYALLWAPVLFLSILIHELAHASMIALFGFGSSAIVLEGMGGVTINERRAKPWQDMLISAAGPASSFVLWWLIGRATDMFAVAQQDPFLRAFLPLLGWMNILWGIFNLLPVMPLDGSSVLRNFLRLFLSERMSFLIAVWVSMIVGVVVAIFATSQKQIFLAILMAWFVRNSYLQWDFFRSHNRPSD